MAQADTLSTGASHAGINPRSTVSLGQVIYTQGHGRICTRPSLFNRHTHDRVFAHTTAANNRGKLWKPVTVFKSAVMGVLFKVLRNRVKVWQRSRFELVQSPTGWGPAVLLQPSPPHRWGGGGGQERITHTRYYSMEANGGVCACPKEEHLVYKVCNRYTQLFFYWWFGAEKLFLCQNKSSN